MQKEKNTGMTLPVLLATSAGTFSDRPAIGKAFDTPLTYKEFWQRVKHHSLFLKDLGVKKEDSIAILGENSPNWAIAYMAIVRIGAVAVPILPDTVETDVHHILTDAKVMILFVTKRQLEKIYELDSRQLKTLIVLDDHSVTTKLVKTQSMDDCLLKASEFPEEQRKKLKAKLDRVNDDDLATIIYTSGTSGHSKAVMLTHKNLFANVLAVNKLVDISPEWTFLSILPMSHAYEFTVGFLLPLLNGARIVFAGKSPTPTILGKICKQEKPTVMCVVPLVLEKIYKKKVLAAFHASKLLHYAAKLPPLRNRIYKSIGKKLLAFFGGHLKLMAIGGAALNEEVEKFLRLAEFPYIVGYGLSESSPVLAGGPCGDPTIALASTGKPLPGVEIKIIDPNEETGIGEIHARGANIMKGYYKNPVLTKETIDEEGWLATGDLGFLDDQGNLHIKGRCKSVIVLAHGENIYPEAIEDKINGYGEVVESLVLENNDRLEAKVYLDYDLLDRDTKGKSQQQKLTHINQLLKNIQAEVNRQLPAFSQLHRIIERPEPFTKTATHKIKRYLYADHESNHESLD